MSKRKVTNGNSEEGDGTDGSPPTKLAPIFEAGTKQHGTWKIKSEELMIYAAQGLEGRGKIASFDMDGTLIKTKSGKVFPVDENDWQFWSRDVVGKLRKTHQDGFKLCIFTNQKGLTQKQTIPFKSKIQNICSAIGVPMQVFISTGSITYRKPYIGMWTRLEEHENGGVEIQKEQSFYVGDAAGRTKTESRPKEDHSCSDRCFALNLDIQFHTPEQFFADQPAEEPFQMPKFNPAQHLKQCTSNGQLDPPDAQFPAGPAQPELLVSVGPPASAKSTFAAKINAGGGKYVLVSQDKLGSWKACVAAAKNALADGRNAIIDNTNRDVETRRRYIELAASMKEVPCRCLLFNCSQANAVHNNNFRKITASLDRAHRNLDNMAIRQFFNNYQEPKMSEGFAEIVRVNFLPDFENEEQRKIYGMFLPE